MRELVRPMRRAGYELTKLDEIVTQIGEYQVRIVPEYTNHIGNYLNIRWPTYKACGSCNHTEEGEECNCKECGGKEVYKTGKFESIEFSLEHTEALAAFLQRWPKLASQRAWNEKEQAFMT